MKEIYGEIALPLDEFERSFRDALYSDESTVQSVTDHLLTNTGKRVRPVLFFLCLNLWKQDLTAYLPVAVAIELIHSATLVHDDVVDDSALRRGQPTVNTGWGNHIAVLTGDYLFAKAFSLLTDFGQIMIIREMSRVVSQMSQGEIRQQAEKFDAGLDERAYLSRIGQKTAYFFTACCSSAGSAASAPADAIAALRGFGHRIGMAFQIVDDMLDFSSEEAVIGKPAASDLRQGIFTLPVIHMLNNSARGEELKVRLGKGEPSESLIEDVKQEMALSQSMEYSRRIAENYIIEAQGILKCLPAAPVRESLSRLASFILQRRY